jgi:hypothetical protein
MDPIEHLERVVDQLVAHPEWLSDRDTRMKVYRLRDQLRVRITLIEALSNSRVWALNVGDGLLNS